MKKWTCASIMVVAACVVTVYFTPPISDSYEGRAVHLSFDDVDIAMRQLTEDSTKYCSIFDHPFFRYLLYLHESYDAKMTLYIYSENKDYSVSDFPNCYKPEFEQNADWLKLGFHAIRPNHSEVETSQLERFAVAYEKTESSIVRFAGKDCMSHTLRLHYWQCTEEERAFLAQHGVRTLLTCDDTRQSYALPIEVCSLLQEQGHWADDELRYLRTDFRTEHIKWSPWLALLNHTENDTIVIFTHEWALTRSNKRVLERMLHILQQHHVYYTH